MRHQLLSWSEPRQRPETGQDAVNDDDDEYHAQPCIVACSTQCNTAYIHFNTIHYGPWDTHAHWLWLYIHTTIMTTLHYTVTVRRHRRRLLKLKFVIPQRNAWSVHSLIISFLRLACGSSVYDHSKSLRDTWAPILEILGGYVRSTMTMHAVSVQYNVHALYTFNGRGLA
jgi:hypothetical protein